jgi:hypothetical protein
MKRKNLLFSLITLACFGGLALAQSGTSSPSGWQVHPLDASAWLKVLRQNQVSGVVDPADVRAARESVNALRSAKSGNSLGLTWQSLGPDNIGGRTRGIVVDRSNPEVVYAGSVGGGVWKSTTGASSWSPMTVNGSTNSAITVSCMVQASNGTIYAGTGEGWYNPQGTLGAGGFIGTGLYKCSDGTDFVNVPGTSGWDFINAVCMGPTNGRIYVATEQGLFYSDDEQTWTLAKDANGNNLNGVATDLCVGSNGIVVVAIDNKGYISETGATDGFVNHSTGAAGKLPLANVGRIEFSVAPTNPDVIYAMAASNIGTMLGVYRSGDKGNTWKLIGPPQSPEFAVFNFTSTSGTTYIGMLNNTIRVYPTDENIVLVGGADLWQGYRVVEEGFFAWSKTSSYGFNPQIPLYVHQGINDIAFHPTEVGTAYLATDGGVFKATQNVGFQAKNKNYKTSQFFSISFGPEGDVMGGSKDNGTLIITGEGNTPEEAEQLYGGDGTRTAISQINPKAHIVSQPNGFLRRTVDYGANWRTVLGTDMSTVRGAYVAPIVLWENFYDNLSTDSVTFVADQDYPAGAKVTVRSKNHSYPFTYQLIAPLIAGNEIRVKDVVKAKLFFGAIGGVWMTEEILDFNGDPRWGQILEVSGTVQALAVSRDGDVVYAGTQDGMLLRVSNLKAFINDSTFAGIVVDTINEWPGRTITSIAFSPSNMQRLVVTLGNYGNTNYVYLTNNALSAAPTFQSAQGNLPAMPVYTSLIEMNDDDRIMIGTEMGVYATSEVNGNTAWVHEGTGMPDVPVFDLTQQTQAQAGVWIPEIVGLDTLWEIFPGMSNFGVIYAASHGRGLFKSDNFVSVTDPATRGEVAGNTLKVYPNPATVTASIAFRMPRSGEAYLQVFDLQGKIILSDYQGGLMAGDNQFTLDADRLNPGTYLVRVHDGLLPLGTGKLIIR